MHFMQKLKMATTNGRKMIFGKNHPLTQQVPWVSKICLIVLSHTVSKINTLLHFTQRWPPKIVGKQFLHILHIASGIKNLVEIARSHTVSE